jgi:hypothetical protein
MSRADGFLDTTRWMMAARWRENVFSPVFCERLLTSLRQP